MAKLTIGSGLDEYLSQLGNLEQTSKSTIGMAVFEGAKIVADEVRVEIQALPTAAISGTAEARRPLKPVEKEGLLEGLGVARMKNDGGFWNVKIGMDGYNADRTKAWPDGKPNAMIARSLEKGTSFMVRDPFITRAVRKAKKKAEAAMKDVVEKQIQKNVK